MEKIHLGCALLVGLTTVAAGAASAAPTARWEGATGRLTLTSGSLELRIETARGINACSLGDRTLDITVADGDYSWPGGGFPSLLGIPSLDRSPDGTRSVELVGRLGDLVVSQRFTAPADEPGVILEAITIRNPSGEPLETGGFRCGFTRTVRRGEEWVAAAEEIRVSPVPYRRETNGEIQEFPLAEIARRGVSYCGWAEQPVPTTTWGAEGWVWSGDSSVVLLAKHNAGSMEWSLIDPLERDGDTLLRFAGAGLWKHGHPEPAARLGPHGSYTFGETRLQSIAGDWKDAYYAYRGYTESKGCRTPEGYDPPIHWNELYDNAYYFKCCELCGRHITPDGLYIGPGFWEPNRALLAQEYTRELMLAEADKARDLGCEALYMDPGWDTGPNQQIWDSERLGPLDAWTRRMREEYGLGVSLWCALGCVPPSYGDPTATPPEARVMNPDGTPGHIVCFASPAFLASKEERLSALCRDGVGFLMFDSNQYSGPCHDPSHGHAVPSTREDHARGLLSLIHRLRASYPELLIELHDPISGPSGIHYTPTYYGYGQPDTFDLWGHEFMWGPLDDILSRRAVSLYYFNLAYSIPLYLHVNLKQDNENSLIFWWFASTCRHLGVGGQPPEPVWAAEKRAMRTYRALKPFYARGRFYGLDETLHAHTLAERGECAINAFNLDDQPMTRSVTFRLAEVGLPEGKVTLQGAPFTVSGDRVTLDLEVPARGHRLIRLRVE